LAQFLNPKRFIYCAFPRLSPRGFDEQQPEARIQYILEHNREEMQACVDKIKRIDGGQFKDGSNAPASAPSLYVRMMNEPVLPGNRLEGSIYDINVMGGALRRVLQDHRSYLVEEGESST